jgi:DNA polymerase sigma
MVTITFKVSYLANDEINSIDVLLIDFDYWFFKLIFDYEDKGLEIEILQVAER